MSDPDATIPVSKPSPDGEASPAPGLSAAELTDSQIQGALTPGASSTRSSFRGWQPPTVEELQRMLPQYQVQQFLARGGMGAVYKGWQQSLDRLVAIKILPPDVEDEDVHYAERFKQEAKAMAKLRHRGIVAVHDAGETPDGLLYFVMEFIEGTDVSQMVAAQGKLPVVQALSITAHVCDALGYAHSKGIVHRDIKPSNIMIEPDGTVKVADFGLAKLITQESAALTRSDVSLGTPDFIAPEALVPGVKVDARADLYAVGVMLYQMLTGQIPRGRFKLPSGIVREIDARLDAVVDKAMQTDREQRYATARELKEDLEHITQGQHLPGAVFETETGPGKPRFRKKPWLIIAAVVVALIAGGSYFLKNRSGNVRDPGNTARETGASSGKPAVTWTDWLGPKQKNPASLPSGLTDAPGGVSTEREITGYEVLPPGTSDAAIRVTYIVRDSAGVSLCLRGDPPGQSGESYIADDNGNFLQLSKVRPGKPYQTLLKKPLPAEWSTSQERILEFSAMGDVLTATLNGSLVASVRDASLTSGHCTVLLRRNLLLKTVEFRVPTTIPVGASTDWTLVDILHQGWNVEADGVSTVLPIRGYNILPDETRDAAARMTYLLRDASGVQITARGRMINGKRAMYVAEEDGDKGALQIGRELPDGAIAPLERKPYPPGFTRNVEHTLEFRIVGDTLTATLNGTFSVAVKDDTLTGGGWAMVLKKGALVKKLEVQTPRPK